MKKTTAARRTLLMGASVVVAALFSGCAVYSTPVVPPKGLIYTNIKHPITTQYNNSPTGPLARKASESKTAFFHDYILTGFSAGWDDAKVADIARKGGIKDVSYAELEAMEILGVYAEFRVTVYGQ